MSEVVSEMPIRLFQSLLVLVSWLRQQAVKPAKALCSVSVSSSLLLSSLSPSKSWKKGVFRP